MMQCQEEEVEEEDDCEDEGETVSEDAVFAAFRERVRLHEACKPSLPGG